MGLHEYVRLLRRRWRLVTLCVLLALSASIASTLTTTKLYTAKAQLFVSAQDRSNSDISSAYTGGLFTQQRVKSYVSLVQSVRAATLVKGDLHLQKSADDIAKQINANAPSDTVLINVSVKDPDPAKAQAIANSVGQVFPHLVDELERPIGGGLSPVKVSMSQSAELPRHPTSPRPKLNLLLGLLVGLGAGIAGSVLRETLDTSVKGPDQTKGLVNAPVLGAINFDTDAAKKPLVVVASPNSPRSEAFRQLRTNLQFVNIEHPLRSVVLTSSVPGEGKSTTACNLAITLTQAGLRVVLVEGDLRRPRIADYMGVEGAVGLTSVLLGRNNLEDALQRWGDGNLQVLASGPLPPNPSELLGSQGMQDLLRELELRCDVVIIDAPPLLPVTDAAVLGTLTSGLVMIVRSNHTRREQVARAVATVHAVGATVLGAVLNMVPAKGPDSYSYGYEYNYQPHPGMRRLENDESPVGAARRGDSFLDIPGRRLPAAAGAPLRSLGFPLRTPDPTTGGYGDDLPPFPLPEPPTPVVPMTEPPPEQAESSPDLPPATAERPEAPASTFTDAAWASGSPAGLPTGPSSSPPSGDPKP